MDLIGGGSDHEVYIGNSIVEPLPREVDCIITDPPYSERTHEKSDPAALAGPNSKNWTRGNGRVDTPCSRRALDYACWSPSDVHRAVTSWSCKGWWVVITDHLLAPIWAAELEAKGLYSFAPLPFVSPGSRVRLAGDGPSSWVCWIIVARPRCAPYSKWGTLPGAYTFNPERMTLVGGKPLSLMKALITDYSRPGDLVCDPCCGAGTTGRAAMDCGRRSLQIDMNPDHAAMAARRLSQQVLIT